MSTEPSRAGGSVKWLTVADVAQEIGVSARYLHDELRRRNLRGTKLPGRAGWRIAPEDLDTYMQAKANVSKVRRSS